MSALILFLNLLLVSKLPAQIPAPPATPVCVRLVGVVRDYSTHRPLSATLSVKIGNKQTVIGTSADATGQFDIGIACTASALLIERTGYRPQRLPLNLTTATDDVYVIIPLVATDQQGVNRPYLQTEQTHYVQPKSNETTGSGQVQHNTFTVTDALAGQPVRAQVCFIFTKTGKRTCLDTDASGNCSTDFTDKDIVAMEVRAPGYQPYQGNISVEQLGGPALHQHVHLLRELVLLSVQSVPAQSAVGFQGMLQPEGSKKPVMLVSAANRPGFFTASDLFPNRYELLLVNRQKTVVHRQTITVSVGLNVAKITWPATNTTSAVTRANTPEQLSPAISTTVTPATTKLADNLPMLLFEEGSCVLSNEARTALGQVGSYLQQHPDVHLRLVGHTDRLGDERLNQYLGEYRAKVAAGYLHWQWGIADNRLEIVGFGSRFLVGANNNEESRRQNRRVSLKFIPAQSVNRVVNSATN
ncbi:OmpA family protein [Fibrella forsythiae]|uniref:OmpA family protein n=1 Tax=Fibrella forsythiae TaxID=2817061 RepID=A0ABS3JK99_9BACT|nr:OmpA family protein [Fibrella forsythiae]MBO0950440.1 OmpA family protein [Fibrella forsythiae]